jgi:hypothetical protein
LTSVHNVQFYSDYDELEAHFRNEHFLCEHEDCLAKKFVVFNLQIELQHHHNENHLGNVPRSRRQVRVPVNRMKACHATN